MAAMTFLCCSDQRRADLRQKPSLNGIDYLEVNDLEATDLQPPEDAEYLSLPPSQRNRLLWQRKLTVYFVNPLLSSHLDVLKEPNLRIQGGGQPESRAISVVVMATSQQSIALRTTSRGDFSRYRLQIARSADDLEPPAVIDPLLAGIDFSFKVDCLDEFVCLTPQICPPGASPVVDIDYLARDYASFRRLMLDRIGTLSPEWNERHVPDLGVTLVELTAYVADYLSYRQEAVATEAYLGTARRRISVRRHARLVDYPMHDGCNARAWVQVVVADNAPTAGITLPSLDPVTQEPTRFLTRMAAPPKLDGNEARDALASQQPDVFELLLPMGTPEPRLYPQHNRIDFYTWGAADCCLPKGATRATLKGALDALQTGDVLILEAVEPGTADPCDPATGSPTLRHPVRLSAPPTLGADPLNGQSVTEVEWNQADALPFALCISSAASPTEGPNAPVALAVARGNIVLVDHGRTMGSEDLGVVPDVPRGGIRGGCPDDELSCLPVQEKPLAVRFNPQLALQPLTQAGTAMTTQLVGGRTRRIRQPFDPRASAASAMRWETVDIIPQIRLAGKEGDVETEWIAVRDLLGSSGNDRNFVVEVETDGTGQLRFGDDTNGLRPTEKTTFSATYRIGNGRRGNVGAESIAHIASTLDDIVCVRNPLPAFGGMDPETIEDVRRFAPAAFRRQERAVTADDYARMAERHPQVQRAAASFRWTGSWRTVFVTADPLADDTAEVSLDPLLENQLEPYRMAGHDLEVDTPRYVPLEIDIDVCARRQQFRADVKRALLEVFSSRRLADGRRGVFHPDNFTFGQPLYLSALYAAAYAVQGVEAVSVTRFQRMNTPDTTPLDTGKLEFGRLEIGRLENDPNFPERGVLRLTVAGGK